MQYAVPPLVKMYCNTTYILYTIYYVLCSIIIPWLYTSGGIFRRNGYIGEVEAEFHRNDD
jgi:hypothetical protein